MTPDLAPQLAKRTVMAVLPSSDGLLTYDVLSINDVNGILWLRIDGPDSGYLDANTAAALGLGR